MNGHKILAWSGIAFLFFGVSAAGCGGKTTGCSGTFGDGIVECDVQCDDGNTDDGDGCSSLCTRETCADRDGDGHTGALCGGDDCDDTSPGTTGRDP